MINANIMTESCKKTACHQNTQFIIFRFWLRTLFHAELVDAAVSVSLAWTEEG